ncbi:threonine aldolase family protein [Oerskovia flava]|uniref:threonine aldolase family protein n=1 Tax=Oerskovia flava TaxID=2986422 RepID=UPI00224026EA|nr:beta-eliminating lyase-related protein [Oerskovia sp. JB1-3-2]
MFDVAAHPSSFASDNYAPAHPEVLAAVAAASAGHVPAYGADPWTARLRETVRAELGEHAVVHPVLNGTGANVVGLMSVLPRWGAVITSEHAHVHVDENGAPERVGGLKLLPHAAPDGRLGPDVVDAHVGDLGDPHRAQPLAVSITQATELGTVYTPEQVRAVADRAHAHGLRLHVDGARIANAAAALGVSLRELTTDAGVDVLSFGGTKNGLLIGEAVIVLHQDAAQDAGLGPRTGADQGATGIEHVRKMTMQLASKMRYVSAQLLALFEPDDAGEPLWRRNARGANAMASRLRAALDDADGLTFTQATEANALFAVLPRTAAAALRERFAFYDWGPAPASAAERLDLPATDLVEVRWMCSWDTTPEDVDAFTDAVRTETARLSR